MSSSCFSSKVSHWVFSWVTCWLNLSDPLPCILPLHLACPRVHEECQCPPAAHLHSRRVWTMNENAGAAALRCIHKWRSHIAGCAGVNILHDFLCILNNRLGFQVIWTYLHTFGHQTLQSAECLALTFCKSCRIFPLLIFWGWVNEAKKEISHMKLY